MSRQDLYLVFGGTLLDPRENVLADPDNVEVAGIYSTYDKALNAWRSRSQANVDDAYVRYFIAPLHRLMHPDEGA
ncbi:MULTISPECIES: DUF4170 domain-containing protein [unclassified Minwuia]|uniref:DUF4170 domain-containing protein n=1 Tax=unclassified Minwuia TaxID=2618799 RepID=UPI002478ABC5|nr:MULTISPECIES: DUF4170 domain-containing protein [unclassified Minwuia]MDF1732529.1 DUF4170 domain-containing protein [Minwuia sp.]